MLSHVRILSSERTLYINIINLHIPSWHLNGMLNVVTTWAWPCKRSVADSSSGKLDSGLPWHHSSLKNSPVTLGNVLSIFSHLTKQFSYLFLRTHCIPFIQYMVVWQYFLNPHLHFNVNDCYLDRNCFHTEHISFWAYFYSLGIKDSEPLILERSTLPFKVNKASFN